MLERFERRGWAGGRWPGDADGSSASHRVLVRSLMCSIPIDGCSSAPVRGVAAAEGTWNEHHYKGQ